MACAWGGGYHKINMFFLPLLQPSLSYIVCLFCLCMCVSVYSKCFRSIYPPQNHLTTKRGYMRKTVLQLHIVCIKFLFSNFVMMIYSNLLGITAAWCSRAKSYPVCCYWELIGWNIWKKLDQEAVPWNDCEPGIKIPSQ